MGVRLVAGRTLEATDDARAPRVMVVNQAFARMFGKHGTSIGQEVALSTEALTFDRPDAPPRLDFPSAAREVVGVVGDLRFGAVTDDIHPTVFLPIGQAPPRDFTITVHTRGDPLAIADGLRAQVRSIDPDQPVSSITTMEDIAVTSLGSPRARSVLMGAFALLAVLLAAVGVYGVISYGVAQRTHEVGIRLALGARPRDVVRLVMGQGATLGVRGVLIGLAGAAAGGRLLRGLLHGVGPFDAATFTLTASTVLAVAVFASWLPARRASRVGPMEALREE
jgi:putative ABC transport system permease protein